PLFPRVARGHTHRPPASPAPARGPRAGRRRGPACRAGALPPRPASRVARSPAGVRGGGRRPKPRRSARSLPIIVNLFFQNGRRAALVEPPSRVVSLVVQRGQHVEPARAP